jgi:hypothetical protein
LTYVIVKKWLEIVRVWWEGIETDKDWNVDIIGETSYFLAVPPNQPGQEYAIATIAIDPGTYSWKAGSPLGFYIRDADGNVDFQFSVAAGKVHTVRVR